MLSFTGQQTQCQNLAQDTSAAALAFFKTNLNLGQRILETEISSFQIEEPSTVSTLADTNSYDLPADFLRLKEAYVTISNTRYLMEQVFDEQEWQFYQFGQATETQDILSKIFVRSGTFEVYPTPATAGNIITLIHETTGKDLTADDYTTGVIQTLANGDETVTGSGTVFTSAMVGRWLKITNDGTWYKIASFTSSTSLELTKAYEGISISGGSEAYIIGQMPRTPDSTHHIPVYFALMQYYQGFKQNEKKANYYRNLYELDLGRAKVTYKRRYSSKYIPSTRRRMSYPINPNHYPSGLTD